MENSFQNIEFLEKVLSKVPGIVFIYDTVKEDYTWTNGKTKDILGFSDADMLDMPDDLRRHFIHPDDHAILGDRKRFFAQDENKTWSGVYRIRHKEGHWVWVYSKQTVYENDDMGNPVKFLGVTVDVMENFRTREIFFQMVNERIRARNQSKLSKLTAREFEIITLIARGLNYHDIAKKLNIQPDTVNKHRKNLQSKLDLHNIASLAYFAKENGLA